MHKLGSECNGAILSDLIKVRDKVNECFRISKRMHAQSKSSAKSVLTRFQNLTISKVQKRGKFLKFKTM